MTKDLIDTKQIEQHFDAANEAAEKSSKMARGAVIEAIEAGEHLTRAKDDLPHGEWAAWLGRHWNYSQDTATRYMTLANSACVRNLKEAKSINEALRMIADDKEEKTVPRSERKPADVVVTTPDPDPAPKPPTNRKTAKGSEKVPDAAKPKTQTVVPEILPDEPAIESRDDSEIIAEWLTERGLTDIVSDALAAKPKLEPKTAAKELRKLADKLDPPDETKPGKVPTASALRAEVDPDTMSEEMMLAVHDWVNHKQNNPDKAYKYKSVESWKRDLRRVLQVANQSGEQFLIEAIDKAISKGWRNWEQEHQNGKANGNGRQTGHDAGGQISSVEKQRRSVERIASRLGFKAE